MEVEGTRDQELTRDIVSVNNKSLVHTDTRQYVDWKTVTKSNKKC